MMSEVCFCGWTGQLEDRAPVYGGAGEQALQCPKCGHLDRLDWLSAAARDRILTAAAQRVHERPLAETPGQAA